ncbi:MAG: calcium-binding protein, partial [Planctomycetaceae bacterium]|nr:calcium-binding protein [Planctomycetaceae bacterium]
TNFIASTTNSGTIVYLPTTNDTSAPTITITQSATDTSLAITDTLDTTSVTLNRNERLLETWSFLLTSPTVATYTYTSGGFSSDLTVLATTMAGQFNAESSTEKDEYRVLAHANDLTFVRLDSSNFTATYDVIRPFNDSGVNTNTETVAYTLVGEPLFGEQWETKLILGDGAESTVTKDHIVTIAGRPALGAESNAANLVLATTIQGLINNDTSTHYNDLTATKVVDTASNNTTLYLVRRSTDASFDPTISVTPAPILGGATRFGEIDTIWTTKIALEAAKNTGFNASQQVVEDDDTWSLNVSGTPVTGTVQSGIDTLTLAGVAAKITPEINNISGIATASWMSGTGTIDITSDSHLPVAITDVNQLRAAGYDHNSDGPLTASDDARSHITTGTYELSTPGTPTNYHPGDVWAVIINGQEITAPGPGDDSPRTLRGLANLLADKIETTFNSKYYAGEQAITATLSGQTGAKILLTVPVSSDTTNSDAFTTGVVTVGGGEVEALFDIDHTSPLKGRVRHPLYYYSSFFGNRYRDFYEYTATVQLQLYKWNESSLQWSEVPTSECDIPAGITGTDPGSSSESDPFIQCNFTSEGEYAVKVNSYIDFADNSTIYGYPNDYYTDREYGVAYNQSYDLIISIQRHGVNAKAIDLDNTIFTLTAGDAAGQVGQIESYNSDRQEYLIKHLDASVAATNIGEFAISSTAFDFFQQDDGSSDPPPTVIDTYTARLTTEPTDDVIVDVLTIPTRTFNASEVFNAAENFGQNEQTQVTAATAQTLIKLEGVAQLGETWSVTVTPTDIDNEEWILGTPVTVSHTVTDTSISAITSALQTSLENTTGITANIVADTVDTILIKLNTSLADKLFFTHFDITSEIVTPNGTKTFADSHIQITTTKTFEFNNIYNADDEITLTITEPNTATSHVINHTILTAADLGTVIKKLSLEVGKLNGFDSTTSFRYEENTFNVDTATLQISSDKRFKTTWKINGIGPSDLLPLSVTFAFDGDAVIGEILTLNLDNDTSINHTTEYRQHPAELVSYFESKIATAKNTSTPAIYNLDIAGRELTISRYDNQPLTSSYIAINTDRFGRANITPQLVFTSSTWANTQNVAVMAINDSFIDGNEALAFPNLSGTLSSIRGPLTIQGGIHAGDDRYLENPITLPNETNLQLSDGLISKKHSITNGDTTTIDILTDYSATHINPNVGERPGFDPRMNDYRYSFVFFNNDDCNSSSDSGDSQSAIATDAGDLFQPEVASVSENILSINGGGNTDFTVSIKKSGSFPAGNELLVTGTPTPVAVTTLQWREVMLEFDVLPTAAGNTINIEADLNLDDNYVSLTGVYPLAANTESATLVKDLADAINASDSSSSVVATVRIGLQGESRLFIRSTSFTDAATGNFKIQIVTNLLGDNQPTVSGTLTAAQAASGSTLWSNVGFINLHDDVTDKKWELLLTRVGASAPDNFTAETSDNLKTAREFTNWFYDVITEKESTFDYSPHVSGSEVTFKTDSISACISVGDGYYYAPYNPNLDVDESQQIDRLILDNSYSIGGDTGVITVDAITGFGMGDGVTLGGLSIPGGIQLSNIEELAIYLGSGDDSISVESTIAGITTLNTGNGDDTVDISDAYGHVNINTGQGDDDVKLGNDQDTISAIGGVLTIDLGTGTADSLNVVNNGSELPTTTTITDHSILGMEMPRLPEIQTIEVRANSGTYGLHASTIWGTTTAPCSIDSNITLEQSTDGFVKTEFDVQYDHDNNPTTPEVQGDDLFAEKIACLLGLANTKGIIVTENHAIGELNYEVKFTNGLSGLDFGQLTWAEQRYESQLITYSTNTINVRATTTQHGTRTANLPRHQTITVTDEQANFAIRLVNLTAPTPTTQTTSSIAFNGTAQDLFDAIDPILNPNNYIEDGSQPNTNNFAVTKNGNVFHLFFRGEHANLQLTPADITTAPRDSGLTLQTVIGGIYYHNTETLDISFGQADDLLNIRGTSATTSLSLNNGDDSIFISSTTEVNSNTQSSTSFLSGNLDSIQGNLAIDAGAGTHRLLISDEAGTTPRSILVTGDAVSANAGLVTPLPPNKDLYIIGLANAPITIDAPPTGDFSRGTTIWTGWNDEDVTIEDTHFRAGIESITSINTGLGNDEITATIDGNTDRLLIVNAQGPYSHVLDMTDVTDTDTIKLSNLSGGNHRVDADDIVITVTDNNGYQTVLDTTLYQVDTTLDRIGLFANSLPRNYQSIDVRIKRDFIDDKLAYAAIKLDETSGNAYIEAPIDLIAGDQVFITIDDAIIGITSSNIDTNTGHITLPATVTYSFDSAVSVTAVRTVVFTFNTPLAVFNDNDKIDATNSTDQLVLIGGHGDDTIHGGSGADILIGDRAIVYYTDVASPGDFFADWTNTPNDVPASHQFGSGGPHDIIAPNDSTADATGLFVVSIEPDFGGSDTLTTGNGRDIAVGGSLADTITTSIDSSDDILFGDNASVLVNLLNSLPLDAVSIFHNTGADDTLTASNGNDILIGGFGNDLITANDGNDVILGDSGYAHFTNTGQLATLSSDLTLSGQNLSATAIGGTDTIATGTGNDIAFGGAAADYINVSYDSESGAYTNIDDDGNDLLAGDNATTHFLTTNNTDTLDTIAFGDGAGDWIHTTAGADIVLGGDGPDIISTGSDTFRDVVLGDNGAAIFVSNNDGRIATDRLQSITTSNADGNTTENDQITTGAGNDIVIGGNARDSISTGSGDDVVAGDNAAATIDVDITQPTTTYILRTITTLTPTIGDIDTITTDEGADIVIGGTAGDSITAFLSDEVERDIILGDNGYVTFEVDGSILEATTTDPAIGGSDTIYTRNGDDIVIGGTAGDIIDAGTDASGD